LKNLPATKASVLARIIQSSGLFCFLGYLLVSVFIPFSDTLFLFILTGSILLLIFGLSCDGQFKSEDIPFLILSFGTFVFGRAFSIQSLNIKGIHVFVTEFLLALSFILLLLKPKKALENWKSQLKPDLAVGFTVYLLMGSIYLLFGLFEHGYFAFRDIVFCHYSLLVFVGLHVLNTPVKIKNLSRVIFTGMTASLLVGCLLNFVPRSSRFPFYRFINETKEFNWSFFFGLIVIFGLCFFAYEKEKRLTRGILVYLSLLFVILTLVRTAWVGLVVALLTIGVFLKKEMAILAVIFPLVFGSLFVIDMLPFRKRITSLIRNELAGTIPGKEENVAWRNVEWRWQIWDQTLQKISQKPLFGWGFGSFPDYTIDGSPVSKISGVGPKSGIVPPHNHILSVMYKTGFLGLVLFLFINIRIFLYGFKHLKKCKSELYRRLLIATLGGLVFWHSIALFIDALESPPTGIFLWILLGLVVSLVHADKINVIDDLKDGI